MLFQTFLFTNVSMDICQHKNEIVPEILLYSAFFIQQYIVNLFVYQKYPSIRLKDLRLPKCNQFGLTKTAIAQIGSTQYNFVLMATKFIALWAWQNLLNLSLIIRHFYSFPFFHNDKKHCMGNALFVNILSFLGCTSINGTHQIKEMHILKAFVA